jgi:hypothetical protein
MRFLFLLSLAAVAGCVTTRSTPVANSMMTGDYVRQFMKDNCDFTWEEREKVSDAKANACSRKWADTFTRRLQEAYPGFDVKQVQKECEATRNCIPQNLERWAQEYQPAPGEAIQRAPAMESESLKAPMKP